MYGISEEMVMESIETYKIWHRIGRNVELTISSTGREATLKLHHELLTHILRWAHRTLGPKQLEAFIKYYFEGHSISETARLLNTNKGNVHRTLFGGPKQIGALGRLTKWSYSNAKYQSLRLLLIAMKEEHPIPEKEKYQHRHLAWWLTQEKNKHADKRLGNKTKETGR